MPVTLDNEGPRHLPLRTPHKLECAHLQLQMTRESFIHWHWDLNNILKCLQTIINWIVCVIHMLNASYTVIWTISIGIHCISWLDGRWRCHSRSLRLRAAHCAPQSDVHGWFLRQEQSSWCVCWQRQHLQRHRSYKFQSFVLSVPELSPLLWSSEQRGLLILGDISGEKKLLSSRSASFLWSCVDMCEKRVYVCEYVFVCEPHSAVQKHTYLLFFFLHVLVPYVCCLLQTGQTLSIELEWNWYDFINISEANTS